MSETEQSASASKTAKAEATRDKIVDAAMELFTEVGYDKTTMRSIAERAGVAVSNAYYYFPSKESLMQGYYFALYNDFMILAEPILAGKAGFEKKLIGVLNAWLDNATPYRAFAASFFRYAANPKSPLSPFSPESAPTREATIGMYTRLVEGSKNLKMSDEVRERLPELLWLYQMGIVLHWVYDDSDDVAKSRILIDKTVPFVNKAIGLSRLPVLKGTANEMMKLIDTLTKRS